MSTIADVARVAGVSIATVSRVLSPGAVPHPVRPETAARVRAAARKLNFTPSPLARGLAVRRSGLVGLVVPDLADPHYPQIAAGVEDAARAADMGVLICNTLGDTDRLDEYLQVLEMRRVEAVVISGATSLPPAALLNLGRWGLPLVLIGRPAGEVRWPHVSIDNVAGGRIATEHLVTLGCHRIVHLAGPLSQTTMADRARGFEETMIGRLGEVIETSGAPEDGYARLRQRLRKVTEVDGVFAATDRLAVAVLALAADRGLDVPRDLAVVGFDDIPLAPYLRPPLSSILQPAHELGTVAFDMARRLATGERVAPVVLQPSLVRRRSTVGPAC